MSILSDVIGWWGLGDFAGDGSTLRDYSSVPHDGFWSTHSPELAEGADFATSMLNCQADDGSYAQSGFSTGHGGGFVSYGGPAFYDVSLGWSFAIVAKCSAASCPGIPTFFTVTPWGTGLYNPGDVVSDAGKVWISQGTFISDGTHPPGDGHDPWLEFLAWEACYGTKVPHFKFGVAGDHSGFPFNNGWSIVTTGDGTTGPAGPDHLLMHFKSESNGAHPPLDLSLGVVPDNQWALYVVTSDGVTVKTYQQVEGAAMAQIASGAASSLVTSSSGIGFGWVDQNLALSGEFENWQGELDEAIMWSRGLSEDEVGQLDGNWCHPSWSLSAAFRAEPSANVNANPADLLQHLSGVRFRAAPSGSPAAAASKTDHSTPAHLSGTRFPSRI